MTSDILHLPEALLLELGVADGQHLVDDQDFGIEIRRDRECQPHVHAAAVALDRSVEKFLDPREIDDLVELLLDLPARHTEDAAVEKDVLAAGELAVEAGANLEQAGDATVNVDDAPGGIGDSRKDLEQSTLTCPVAANDTDGFTLPDVEVNIVECPERLTFLTIDPERVLDAFDDRLPERRRPVRVVGDQVRLAQTAG